MRDVLYGSVTGGIFVSSFWISYYLEKISFLPDFSILHYLTLIFAGFVLFLYLKDVKKSFYAAILLSIFSSIVLGFVLYLPGFLDIVAEREGIFYVALKEAITAAMISFPLSFMGAMAGSILYPD